MMGSSGNRLQSCDAALADLHAQDADPRVEHRVPAAEPDARLAELGTVQQQAELRVVEPGAVGIERVADRGEAGPAALSEGFEVVNRGHRGMPTARSMAGVKRS